MAAEGKVNVNNLVQNIVQHWSFGETIYSILMATNQEQSCLLLRLKFRNTRGASQHPAFMGNCLTNSHTCWPYLHSRWFLLVVGVNQENYESRRGAGGCTGFSCITPVKESFFLDFLQAIISCWVVFRILSNILLNIYDGVLRK